MVIGNAVSFFTQNMSWSFGVNKHVPVHNLSDGNRKVRVKIKFVTNLFCVKSLPYRLGAS